MTYAIASAVCVPLSLAPPERREWSGAVAKKNLSNEQFWISDRRSGRGVDASPGYVRLSDANACDADENSELHRRDPRKPELVNNVLVCSAPNRTREHNEGDDTSSRVPPQSWRRKASCVAAAHHGQPNGHEIRVRRLRAKGADRFATENTASRTGERSRDFPPTVFVRPKRKHCACNRARSVFRGF